MSDRNREIEARYRDGIETLEKIAEDYGLTPARISQIGRAAGLTRRKPHRDEVLTRVREREETGESYADIARAYGVSRQAIRSLALAHGAA